MTQVRAQNTPLALSDDLGLMLSRLGTVTRLRIAEALAPIGLTMRQFAVLRALASDEGLSQAALGERLQIDASSIVLVLDECQKSGWLERRPSSGDRRRYAIHLTPAGGRVLVRAREAASKAESKFFEPLDAAQRRQLQDLLMILAGTGQVVSSPSGAPATRRASA